MKRKTNYLDSTFAELTWDAGFKATFRDVNNTDALILLLNTFLPKERTVVSVEFLDREQNGLSAENKTNVYDLHCKDQDGNDFIVEMQREDIGNYLERCMTYASASYLANLDKGDYDYESAVPVYLISFIVEKSKDPRINDDNELINRFGFAKYYDRFLENQLINFIFVKLYEVRRIQTPDINTSPAERFSWLMMHLPTMKHDPAPEIVGDCGPIIKAAKIAGFDREKKRNYVANMDKEHLERAIRHQNRIDGIAEGFAEGRAEGRELGLKEGRQEGLEEGRKEGLKEGRQEGLEEGRKEGLEEGKAEEKREIARNMLELNMDIQVIAQVTGLSTEDIQSL